MNASNAPASAIDLSAADFLTCEALAKKVTKVEANLKGLIYAR